MRLKNGQANIFNGLVVTGTSSLTGISALTGDVSVTVTGSTPLTVTSNVSSTPSIFNAAGSATVALELQALNTRRFRILSTSATTTFEATNTSGFIMNSMLNVQSSVTASNSLRVSGSTTMVGSGSTILSIDGSSGRLFSVDDSLSGSLFSVNTAAGLPVMEAFSDNTVRIGQYGTQALFVSKSRVGIGKETQINSILDVSGSVSITGSLSIWVSGSFVLPLTASATPVVGSAYWSGSFLFVYNGTTYLSSSFS
jgi:hypothetical protein